MISTEFKQQREELGLSRPELATELKCSTHTIKAYELGNRNPDVLRLEAFHKLIIENKLKKGVDS